ncbi:MAG: cytochrome o ubiquinol oxidase subunit IV [Paracoccaceae bacterium]|nr:cytochrome o ubiquinol oxidase subunit IV [Paracoccaceae bacterium]
MKTENASSREAYLHDLRGYQTGLLLAVLLTVVPFGLVAWGGLSYVTAMSVVAVLAIVQIVVHVRYFLHVDLSPERRDDLHLILFSALLLAIMVAGSIWILVNLQTRMMMPM